MEVRGGRQRELAADLEDGSSLLLYEGDLVVTTRPVHGVKPTGRPTGRPVRRVENGETGMVVATDPKKHAVTVRLRDRDWVVDEEHLPALDLAYAQHLYRAQGRTVTEVLVCGGGWQTDRTTGYVGVTRARETSVVITDSSSLDTPEGDTQAALQALAARWAEAHPAVAASTLLQQAELAAAAPAEPALEPEAELEPAETAPEPRVELEPGWTLVDQPQAERDTL